MIKPKQTKTVQRNLIVYQFLQTTWISQMAFVLYKIKVYKYKSTNCEITMKNLSSLRTKMARRVKVVLLSHLFAHFTQKTWKLIRKEKLNPNCKYLPLCALLTTFSLVVNTFCHLLIYIIALTRVHWHLQLRIFTSSENRSF